MNPAIFNFNEQGVRVAFDSNNEPLFCLPDVCKVLGISRSSDLVQVSKGFVLNEPPKRNGALNPAGVHKIRIPTNGGMQELTFVNEENLYRIIFRSDKSEALKFQTWVFAEVLPSICKTGSYSARQTAFDELNRLCLQEKVSKDKGSFHSHGMHKRKREKHLNALRIETCKANLQLTFEGVHND